MTASFEDRTSGEVAGLRRRRFWTGLLLWLSIAMIPLGFAIPCGLGIALKHIEPMFLIGGVAAVILPALGLGGAILMYLDRSRYARSWGVAQFALQHNYSYAYRPADESFAYLTQAQLFTEGDGASGKNLVEGTYKGCKFTFVDFQYYLGFGEYAHAYEQTVLTLHDGAEGAPVFVLFPKGWMDRLTEALGGTTIKIRDEPDFNKAFTVTGLRANLIADRLSAGKMIDYCLEEPHLAMGAENDDLIVFRDSRLLQPHEYENFLKRALKMAAILRNEA